MIGALTLPRLQHLCRKYCGKRNCEWLKKGVACVYISGWTMKKQRCRCYINATYNSKTAWRTGHLPKPCPIHEPELTDTPCSHNGPTMTHSNGDPECLSCHDIIGKMRG
jgi:hypothetical protein